jgi:proteic killer suppression protein
MMFWSRSIDKDNQPADEAGIASNSSRTSAAGKSPYSNFSCFTTIAFLHQSGFRSAVRVAALFRIDSICKNDGKNPPFVQFRRPAAPDSTASAKLLAIDAAKQLTDLRAPPANRLEARDGNREGQTSIRVNNQWRICFEWHDGEGWDVEIVDYQ